ncbi:hypothetical protein Tco_0638444 [Tanacetum coccineum]
MKVTFRGRFSHSSCFRQTFPEYKNKNIVGCALRGENTENRKSNEKLRLLLCQVINTPYSIDLNTLYGSSEGQYVVLNLQNTPYCLEEHDTLTSQVKIESAGSFLSQRLAALVRDTGKASKHDLI